MGIGSNPQRTADLGKETAFLGQGTRLSGKVTFEGTARIEGEVEGEVTATDTLLIGEEAVLNAQINGQVVIIHGKVTGDIHAQKKLEIRAPGKLFGNVTTPSLVIEEGVVFEGHCSMGSTSTRDRKVTLLATDEDESSAKAPAARDSRAGGEGK